MRAFTHNAYGVRYAPNSLKIALDVTNELFASFQDSRKIDAVKTLREHVASAEVYALEIAPFSQIAIWNGMAYKVLQSNLEEATEATEILDGEDSNGSAQFADYISEYQRELTAYMDRRFTTRTAVLDTLYPNDWEFPTV